jgi:ADP-ribosylglycohydrolase
VDGIIMNAYERALGSLYGMATGDALGVPSSFQTMEQIRQKWGWIDDFLPPEPGHIFHDGLRAGEYTDDTEQALALISSFVRNGRVVPIDIVEEIMKWAERVKGKYASPLGPSTERALKAIRAGTPIEESGRFGTTNGSAMRISPLGIIHGLLGSDAAQMVGDVRLTCLPTHNTTVSISSTAAIAYGVAMCMHGERDLVKIIDGTKTAADLGARHGNTVSAPSVSRRIDYICGITHGNREPRKAMEEIYALFGGGDLAAGCPDSSAVDGHGSSTRADDRVDALHRNAVHGCLIAARLHRSKPVRACRRRDDPAVDVSGHRWASGFDGDSREIGHRGSGQRAGG